MKYFSSYVKENYKTPHTLIKEIVILLVLAAIMFGLFYFMQEYKIFTDPMNHKTKYSIADMHYLCNSVSGFLGSPSLFNVLHPCRYSMYLYYTLWIIIGVLGIKEISVLYAILDKI